MGSAVVSATVVGASPDGSVASAGVGAAIVGASLDGSVGSAVVGACPDGLLWVQQLSLQPLLVHLPMDLWV